MLSNYILLSSKISGGKLGTITRLNTQPRGKWAYALVGLGVLLISRSDYEKGSDNSHYFEYLENINKGEIQSNYAVRAKNTITYFAGGIGMIALLSSCISRSSFLIKLIEGRYGKMLPFPLSILCTFALNKSLSSNYSNNKSLIRNILFIGHNASLALLIAPVINHLGNDMVKQAMLLTGGCFSIITLLSYITSNKWHLKFSGITEALTGALFSLGASNFYLKSKLLEDAYLYGGLGFYHLNTFYNFKNTYLKAKYQPTYDPIIESLDSYINIFNIFVHILRLVCDLRE